MNEIIERIIAQPIPAAFVATGLVLFAICATWPARRLWRWWRGRKVKLGAMTMLDFAKAEKVYFDAFMAPDDTWNAIKAIAAGYAASGSKPDESGRPVTRREFLDDRDEIDDCFVDHESRIGGLESRIAALEAAQKPAQPGVLIDGAWWRGFERKNFLHLQRDGSRRGTWVKDKRACMTRPAWTWCEWLPDDKWPTTDPATELPESSVRAMHAEAKKQGVV